MAPPFLKLCNWKNLVLSNIEVTWMVRQFSLSYVPLLSVHSWSLHKATRFNIAFCIITCIWHVHMFMDNGHIVRPVTADLQLSPFEDWNNLLEQFPKSTLLTVECRWWNKLQPQQLCRRTWNMDHEYSLPQENPEDNQKLIYTGILSSKKRNLWHCKLPFPCLRSAVIWSGSTKLLGDCASGPEVNRRT